MKKRILYLIIITILVLPVSIINANTQLTPVSPVCEFHGFITETLDRNMNPTTKIDEIEGFSIKIYDARPFIRGDVQTYPSADCSEKLENKETKRLIDDMYTSDGVEKYSKEYFKVDNRISGNIQLFDSGIYSLGFYTSPPISNIQEGEFYTLSQLRTPFWAQNEPVSFSTEGYFVEISEGEILGQGWSEIVYSAGFTEIPVNIEKLEELEAKLEEYSLHKHPEKISLYGRDLRIPSRYNSGYFSIKDKEVEKIREDLKKGELYELTITHDGEYSGDGFTLQSYKLKNDGLNVTINNRSDEDKSTSTKSTDKNVDGTENISKLEPENKNYDSEINSPTSTKIISKQPKEKSFFSKIWSFIKSIFN